MARILYKNVRTRLGRTTAMRSLRKNKLTPYFTDGRTKGTTKVYAVARTKKVKGFRAKNEKMSYV